MKESLVWFQDTSKVSFRDRMKEFMLKFDENGDGKIEMSEVNSHPFSSLVCSCLKLWRETILQCQHLRSMKHQEDIQRGQ